MAAAPADFRPRRTPTQKIKKPATARRPIIELVTNPDIAAELGAAQAARARCWSPSPRRPTTRWRNGRAKLARKRADLIVVNEVGAGKVFGADDNEVTVLGADGTATHLAEQPKDDLADAVWDLVADRSLCNAVPRR